MDLTNSSFTKYGLSMPTLFNMEVMGAYSKLGKRGNFTF